MDSYLCMAESLCCSPKAVTTLLTGYTPVQNKKLKKNPSLTFSYLLSIRLKVNALLKVLRGLPQTFL